MPEDVYISGEERGHGKVENREVRTVREEGKKAWKDKETIIEYRCHRTENGKRTVTNRYYISNADMGAEGFYQNLRGHRSIGNRLHWSLDVIFREDAACASKEHEVRESEYTEEDGACAS